MVRSTLVLLAMLAGVPALSDDPHPHWIWSDGASQVRLMREFRTTAAATTARLRVAPHSARLTVSLDGQRLAEVEPYDPIREIEIEQPVDAGPHKLIVEAAAVEGPPAFFLQATLRLSDDSQQIICSDDQWKQIGGRPAKDLGPIDARLIIPDNRRVGIDVVDNYEQWKQALGASEGNDPATFLIAPDFEIQRVRSALPEEDSWVSLVFDGRGRAIIAKEQQGLLRMTLDEDGVAVTRVETLADSLKECRGLAFLGDDLFANANNSKGLYKLAADGEQLGTPQLIFESSGGVGHGRNDLAVGPGGMLYSIHGDSVDLPSGAVDYTSPFREARRGKKSSEGHLLRIDPGTGTVELLAAGLRNPFGIDFNERGDIFTYDADAEYDMGSPWYRPTRVSHLVTGGDYGWRGVTKSWPPYYPDHVDNAKPSLDIGKGSPTAVKFGTRSNFPKRYREALFILDWAYGRIIAVHIVPRGSGYLMTGETFLKGRPLNVTDLDFGPDGSMYFVTGGRKTKSGLYRVRFTGAATEPEPKSIFRQRREKFASDSRTDRIELEVALEDGEIDTAWTRLASDDPGIRLAARNVLERQPVEGWWRRAVAETNVRRASVSLLALARSLDGEQRFDRALILNRLNQLYPRIDHREDKLAALQTYWLCLQQGGDVEGTLRIESAYPLNRHYPSTSSEPYTENRLLSEILVRLRAPDVVAKTVALLNQASSQVEQMHYLYVLRNVRHGWTIDDRRAYFAGLQRARHYRGGAGMVDFLNKIREEAVATLSAEEKRQLGSAILADAGVEDEVVDQEPRTLVRKWTVDELAETVLQRDRVDVERGGRIFAAASCIKCHRFGARGTLIGPDLTSVSRRFSRVDLLRSIVKPSHVIAENYRSLQIVTSDGKAYVGQATLGGDYRSPTLRLATDPSKPLSTIEIPKTEIESQSTSKVSWMPEGLLDSFHRDEIRDLIAYLESAP